VGFLFLFGLVELGSLMRVDHMEREFARYQLQGCEIFRDIETCQYNAGNQRYFRVREVAGNLTRYFSLTDRFVGSGAFGRVYVGRDLRSGDEIVIKKTDVGRNEVKCLHIMDMYLGGNDRYILMKRARGVAYDDILSGGVYKGVELIRLHEGIIEEFKRMNKKGVRQGDPYPRHIFVDDVEGVFSVDIIDYGLCNINPAVYDDICGLNGALRYRYYEFDDVFVAYLRKKERC